MRIRSKLNFRGMCRSNCLNRTIRELTSPRDRRSLVLDPMRIKSILYSSSTMRTSQRKKLQSTRYFRDSIPTEHETWEILSPIEEDFPQSLPVNLFKASLYGSYVLSSLTLTLKWSGVRRMRSSVGTAWGLVKYKRPLGREYIIWPLFLSEYCWPVPDNME